MTDIHNYQSLSPTFNGQGQLIGTWGADGRDVDPGLSFDGTERTATLASFNGSDPNGDWVIYFRDASPGDISTLNGWSVGVAPVPEPVNLALGVFAWLLVAGGCWRARRSLRRTEVEKGGFRAANIQHQTPDIQ